MTPPQESSQSREPGVPMHSDAELSPERSAEAPGNRPTEPGLESATADNNPERQLAQAQQHASALQEALQRERADFVNYRRRVAQERDELGQRMRVDVFRALLPVLDDLERALLHTPPGGTREPWVEGYRLVGRKLVNLLEHARMARIGAAGEPFDPRFHEAVGQRPPAHPGEKAGMIAEIVRPGYRLGDEVLRPAQVVVVSDTYAQSDSRDAQGRQDIDVQETGRASTR
jgi:molecular chaperone GrpE